MMGMHGNILNYAKRWRQGHKYGYHSRFSAPRWSKTVHTMKLASIGNAKVYLKIKFRKKIFLYFDHKCR